MRETFETLDYLFDRNLVGVQYSDVTGQWNVKGKNADRGNSLVNMTYRTSRANAYRILEDSLNLRDTSIFDTIEEDGKEKRVLNKKETMLASQKQFITKFPNVVIGLFAVVIFVVFDVVSSTKNDVIMNVSFVNMGGNNIRIFSL